MVFVTFRQNDEKLTSMFCGGGFHDVEEAKDFIQHDAKHFLSCHSTQAFDANGKKFRQKRGWRNPSNEDYYEVQAKDGSVCIWQYFNRV